MLLDELIVVRMKMHLQRRAMNNLKSLASLGISSKLISKITCPGVTKELTKAITLEAISGLNVYVARVFRNDAEVAPCIACFNISVACCAVMLILGIQKVLTN